MGTNQRAQITMTDDEIASFLIGIRAMRRIRAELLEPEAATR